MKARFYGLTAALAVFVLTGCRSVPSAPLTAAGQKYEILVYCDRGDPNAMNKKQYSMRQEVGNWMERDLVNQLRRSGYEPKLVKSKDAYRSGEGKYLLSVGIVSYNPGSSAARAFVGYGAGAAALNNSYELKGMKGVVAAWKDGAGTSQHWTRIPRTLNARAVRKVTATLGGK